MITKEQWGLLKRKLLILREKEINRWSTLVASQARYDEKIALQRAKENKLLGGIEYGNKI